MTHDDQPKYGRRADDFESRTVTPEQIARLRKAVRETALSSEPRRDPFGIVLASVLLVFGFGTAWLTFQGGWWMLLWIIAGPFILFGAVGLAHDVPKVPRDEHGRHLPR